MAPRLGAAVSWMLVVASLAFWSWWGLRPRPQPVVTPSVPVVATADLGQLLGAPPTAAGAAVPDSPALAARIRLLGVVATRESAMDKPRGGVALLAVDGKPPRPYRVGAKLDGDLMLQAVGQRTATIATINGDPKLRLELPKADLASPGAAPVPARLPVPAPLPPELRGVPVNTDPEAAERQAPGPNDPVPATPSPENDPQQQGAGDSAR